MQVQFVVTDTARDMAVVYSGLLPDVFKEGKGVVAQLPELSPGVRP
jgi:cytochrome c-type biogenesis protein CcmE